MLPTETSAKLAEQVFATPELLEQILLYLSMFDIMRTRTVQRKFNNTVLGSPLLRTRLWLDTEPRPMSEFLYFPQPSLSCRTAFISPHGPGPKGSRSYVMVEIHPAIAATPGVCSIDSFHLRNCVNLHFNDALAMIRWRSGAWEEQFLTQPPRYTMSVSALSRPRFEVRDERGLRLGTLVKALAEAKSKVEEDEEFEDAITLPLRELRASVNMMGAVDTYGAWAKEARREAERKNRKKP